MKTLIQFSYLRSSPRCFGEKTVEATSVAGVAAVAAVEVDAVAVAGVAAVEVAAAFAAVVAYEIAGSALAVAEHSD